MRPPSGISCSRPHGAQEGGFERALLGSELAHLDAARDSRAQNQVGVLALRQADPKLALLGDRMRAAGRLERLHESRLLAFDAHEEMADFARAQLADRTDELELPLREHDHVTA